MLNIERTDLDIVQENSEHQPNIIRVKPTSQKNIYINRLSVPVSSKNVEINNNITINESKKITISSNKIDEPEIKLGETKTADLFFVTDSIMQRDGKEKPINLNKKMTDIVYKNHDEIMKRFNLLTMVRSEEIKEEKNIISDKKEEIIPQVATIEPAFDTYEPVEVTPEIEQEMVNDITNIPEPIAIDIEIDNIDKEYNDSIGEFISMIEKNNQMEKSILNAENELNKVSNELDEAKTKQNDVIIKNYELERKVQEARQQQRKIIDRETENIRTSFNEKMTKKSGLDLQIEEKVSELEKTNFDINTLEIKNAYLEQIISAMENSVPEEEKKIVA